MSDWYRIILLNDIDSKFGIIKVNFTVPHFAKLLNNSSIREFCTDIDKDYADDLVLPTKFEFKLKFPSTGHHVMGIYYLSSEAVCVKTDYKAMIKESVNDEHNIIHYFWHSNNNSTGYEKMEPNEYHFVTSMLEQNDLPCLQKTNCKELIFSIDFTIHVHILTPSLVPDLKNLLQSSMHTDITIKSSEGAEFHAHKVLLIARSDVLKAHFQHNTQETITNVIESPFEMEVLQEIVTYIYTDNAPKVDEIPEKLLAAADFYQLYRLKSLCEEELFKRLTVHNAIEILQLADLHSATFLKSEAMEFISSHDNAKLITKTKSWEKLESLPLIKSLFELTHQNL